MKKNDVVLILVAVFTSAIISDIYDFAFPVTIVVAAVTGLIFGLTARYVRQKKSR